MGIAGRLDRAIVAEFGKPVAHLGPAVFLGHAAVVMADLDLHVRFSRRSRDKRRAAKVTLPRDSERSGMMDRATAAGPRRAGRRSHPTAGLSGAVMSRYRTCRPAHGVYRKRSPLLPLDPPSKAPGSSSLGFKCYHDPHVISQQDKRLVNIRLICHLLQCGMWIITDFSVCTGLIRALPR
jgi:hypothetical protein